MCIGVEEAEAFSARCSSWHQSERLIGLEKTQFHLVFLLQRRLKCCSWVVLAQLPVGLAELGWGEQAFLERKRGGGFLGAFRV